LKDSGDILATERMEPIVSEVRRSERSLNIVYGGW
jgi:hypothetical protein